MLEVKAKKCFIVDQMKTSKEYDIQKNCNSNFYRVLNSSAVSLSTFGGVCFGEMLTPVTYVQKNVDGASQNG